ncbi:MAG: FAD-dependent oxidoreductase [Planctomycetota bacterium]
MKSSGLLLAILWTLCSQSFADETVECDLLVVGGNEAGVAAAVQAARLGVPRVVLVNDIAWLGGQFSAEGVGCVDEWTVYRGQRVNFPRSGIFLEVINRICERNKQKYGLTNPGNAWCGTETIEPAEAAALFERLIAPYRVGDPVGQAANLSEEGRLAARPTGTGSITYLQPWEPVRVDVQNNTVRAVEFAKPDDSNTRLVVRAKLTIDCSDWGDVVRLSGAKYSAGPDLKSRFGEPGAPEGPLGEARNEMNPLSWCVVLREAGRDVTITPPGDFDPRKFTPLDKIPPFVDTDMKDGIYSPKGWCIYTHRRLVDRRHNGLPVGTEKTFLNWPNQDYPLYDFPKQVADALDATEPGASKKNLVEMTPAQRRIVFDDAKRHALGLLYYLQTKVHDRVGDYPQSFRYMELTDEFGTPDRLPPKPYVREALRLEALYMLREHDIRAADRNPRWAKAMVPDAVFGFQFNIDFHPTRRKFLDGGNTGPWQFVHTANRNWHTDTDRGMLPLRSLVPVEINGLLGASKNIGVSSLVSSAVRVHGQMMLSGQASGTAAWLCLRDNLQPRDLARNWPRIRELQQRLVRSTPNEPGILLWPYHDLSPDDPHFESANLLAVRGIWPGDPDSLDFQPTRVVTRGELAAILTRAAQHAITPNATPKFPALTNPDTAEKPADWQTLSDSLKQLGLTPSLQLTPNSPVPDMKQPLQRSDLARLLWLHLKALPERLPNTTHYLKPGHDSDADGIPDLDDPLPLNDGET